jgi:ABC-type branched-subunit amino acid transport system ATPase component
MDALLQVRNVNKRYSGIVANKDVSLSVPKGGVVGLIGPNGSGKTTLFKSIVGYHPIDSGSIAFDGREISHLRVGQIARLGLTRTFQQTRVYSNMSCMDNMRISLPSRSEGPRDMFAKFSGKTDQEAKHWLEFVGLNSKRFLRAGELSFGQQKLLEFAMALMNRPKMLLLDEPTAGVNPTLINDVIVRLQQANAEFGITLLVIEHNLRVIMSLVQYVYCLAHGELLSEGPPHSIQSDQAVIDAYLGAL